MQDQLPPNKTGNERGMLDPSSTGYDREMGNQNRMGEMQTMRSAGIPYSLTETDFRNIVNEIRTQEAST